MDEKQTKLGGFVTSYIALGTGITASLVWLANGVESYTHLSIRNWMLAVAAGFGLLSFPLSIVSFVRIRRYHRPLHETIVAGIGLFLGMLPGILLLGIFVLLSSVPSH